MYCNCDLRYRRWNANTGKCQACGQGIPPGNYGHREPSERKRFNDQLTSVRDAMHTYAENLRAAIDKHETAGDAPNWLLVMHDNVKAAARALG